MPSTKESEIVGVKEADLLPESPVVLERLIIRAAITFYQGFLRTNAGPYQLGTPQLDNTPGIRAALFDLVTATKRYLDFLVVSQHPLTQDEVARTTLAQIHTPNLDEDLPKV